ncbi:MAG: hypothetical protein RBU37_17230 [Myxococcota bacterium]|nr:hypothetical protein [Myxococcota bacterium]
MLSQLCHLSRAQLPLLMLLSLLPLLVACAPDPAERIAGRIEALVELLESNKHDTDKLLEELERFVTQEEGGFAKDLEEIEAMSEEKSEALQIKHEKRLRSAVEKLMNVSVEIQDRLSSHPEKLSRFVSLMARLH